MLGAAACLAERKGPFRFLQNLIQPEAIYERFGAIRSAPPLVQLLHGSLDRLAKARELCLPLAQSQCFVTSGHTGGIFCGQRVVVSEPVIRKINIYPFVSFLRPFCLKIQLEIDFHPLF